MISADNSVERYFAFSLAVVIVQQFAGISRGVYYACVTAAGKNDYSLICCMLVKNMTQVWTTRRMENGPFKLHMIKRSSAIFSSDIHSLSARSNLIPNLTPFS